VPTTVEATLYLEGRLTCNLDEHGVRIGSPGRR
jgi:hypothetical protein